MSAFLSGAVTFGYLIGALFFVRFWRRSADRLFLWFAIAFILLALNQFLAHVLNVISEPYSFVYGIRVLAFVLIIVAVVEKNTANRRR
ncbi:MAG: DUF5985 family protein [Betaproteobacteria bacterium]